MGRIATSIEAAATLFLTQAVVGLCFGWHDGIRLFPDALWIVGPAAIASLILCGLMIASRSLMPSEGWTSPMQLTLPALNVVLTCMAASLAFEPIYSLQTGPNAFFPIRMWSEPVILLTSGVCQVTIAALVFRPKRFPVKSEPPA